MDAEDAEQEFSSERFTALGLSEPIRLTLDELGYEDPTPIQQQTIPLLLAGRDVMGQAQTGTGKTAAFALPILMKLDLNLNAVQALVLTPTRELAIQVAEAVHTYSKRLGRVKVIPVYGGDPIQKQIGRLRGGIHIVVGTPGRIMDHLRRGTLDFSALKPSCSTKPTRCCDMGFQEDVEWILGQMPEGRQMALFSATLPREVRRIADRYLHDPASISIEHKTMTVPTVEQQYIQVSESQKLEALTHLLETEADPRRGHPDLRPHQAAGGRAGRAAAGARLRRRSHARRHESGPARKRGPPPARRPDGDRRGDRRSRARSRRGPHRTRDQLRHSLRPRSLRPPHRPHCPRRPDRQGHPVCHAARDAHDARDRALHPPAADARQGAQPGRRGRAPARPCSKTASSRPWRPTSWSCTWRWSARSPRRPAGICRRWLPPPRAWRGATSRW